MKNILKKMILIRKMEEACAELYTQQKIRGFLHLYIGEEAVATGVFETIRPEDNVVATYREHAHALLKGIPLKSIMAEMFGKEQGCCKGHGGSMHLFSREVNFYGGQAIVSAGLPLAVGLALGNQLQKKDQTTFCFFGEGASAEGDFHESLNLASLWNLPILFCCENNLYAMGTAWDRFSAQTNLIKKVEAYKMYAQTVDGMNVLEVIEKTKQAVNYMQREHKPAFLEFKTYRFKAHSMFDPDLYRPKDEILFWKQHCPIDSLKKFMLESKLISEKEIFQMEQLIDDEIQSACLFAEESPFESVENLLNDVYAKGGL
jgi:pyruvate dehydrogenase E1 component alpha subunit